MNRERLAGRIRQRRQQLGLSVKELAKRAGVSASYIYAIEAGMRGSSIEKLSAIAKELNIPIQTLLE
ncbi:helix-turn-helix transcriptional regulator [Fodinisporobacter ferrooxydans]|uniref:Helix-turn-helix transcriptional regulator n=1 Tax=Fodinisporobacter ferrooxydans TaxID=2901836 RepID=A0ABY4CP32_9BACL|nr:helix-turn-helix transcriptional regulator [Alicyclobacillaceae bacterium MYW30-H2]